MTATFATGGIIVDAGFFQVNCPLTLTGTLLNASVVLAGGLLALGSITGAIPTSPCNGLGSLVSSSNPWLISYVALGPTDGRAWVRIRNVQISYTLPALAVACLFSGDLNATIAGGVVGNRSGALPLVSGPCGDATVSGDGGALGPGQTITSS